ncbi:MAG: pyruvate kinase [Trueperaceae bacterium]
MDQAPVRDPNALLDTVLDLSTEVDQEAARRLAVWGVAEAELEVRASAENLARYLALRRRDLAELQRALVELGLSSLGRSEARVRPQLDAVAVTLAALAGRTDAPPQPDADAMWQGERLLQARAVAALGPQPRDRRVRVISTLPSEAADGPDLVARLLAAGADGVRINAAHDGPEAWRAMAAYARAAAAEQGRSVFVEVDLAGPKVRVADGAPDGKQRVGDALWLAGTGWRPADDLGEPTVSLTLPGLLADVRVGDQVWFDDGRLGGRVEWIDAALPRDAHAAPGVPEVAVLVRVTHVLRRGQRVRVGKGVNFPDTVIAEVVPTADDLAALPTAVAIADAIGFSFVQRPGEVDALHDAIAALAPARLPALVLKVETRLAVSSLPSLIVAALRRGPAAVMIARGDLAVELGFERLAEVQEELLWICEAAHVPAIWATQVLEGVAKNGMPTRAEVTDAAMAERAEGVLLNKGPYAEVAVGTLADVLRRMHRHQHKKTAHLAALGAWAEDLP